MFVTRFYLFPSAADECLCWEASAVSCLYCSRGWPRQILFVIAHFLDERCSPARFADAGWNQILSMRLTAVDHVAKDKQLICSTKLDPFNQGLERVKTTVYIGYSQSAPALGRWRNMDSEWFAFITYRLFIDANVWFCPKSFCLFVL